MYKHDIDRFEIGVEDLHAHVSLSGPLVPDYSWGFSETGILEAGELLAIFDQLMGIVRDIDTQCIDIPGVIEVCTTFGLEDAVIYAARNLPVPETLGSFTGIPWVGFDAALACSGPGTWVARNIPKSDIRFRANTLLGAAQAVPFRHRLWPVALLRGRVHSGFGPHRRAAAGPFRAVVAAGSS